MGQRTGRVLYSYRVAGMGDAGVPDVRYVSCTHSFKH